jgi:glutathione S-transferase
VVSREKTLEGEFFIKSTEVPLKDLPPLISGTFNVVADISPGTALFDIVSHANVTRSRNGATADALHDDWDAEKDYSLLVTMCGFDDTYKSEVRTFHKYWPKDVYTNFEFDDSIKISASGVPYIDWVSFHQASRIGVPKDRPMEFIARGSDTFTTVTPPELFPSSSVHLFGLGDEIVVNKERVLVGSGCKYTLAVEMLLRELRVPYMLHVVQQPAKGAKLEKSTQPAWYRSQQVPGSSLPVLYRRGKWMQETLSIMDAIIQDSPLQAVDSGMRLRKSMLHPLFTPERCNTIVMKYLNHEAYDEGSVRHLEGGAGKFSSTPATAVTFNPSSKDDEWYSVNPSGALLTGERREMAIMHACELCSEELSPLEAHLRTYPYCCGDEPGPDDFLRFNLLYTCLFVLAPLWRLDAPLFRGCPCIHQWLLALAERDSSPYGEEGEGRHDVSQSLIMEGNKFKRLLPNRYFASHRLGLQRDLVVEPSGPSPTAPPALYPDSILHVFGQGVKVSTGAFRNAPTTVGSMCLHTVALEMVLRELRIPYVLHLLPHTAAEVSQRAPWFTDTFRDSALIKSSTGSSGNPNTPAVYFKGRFYSTEMMQRLLGVVPSKERQQRKVEEALGGGGSNDGIDTSAIIIAYLVQQYLLEDGKSSYEDYDESRAREVLEFSTRRLLLGASHHSYNAHDHRHASKHSSRDDANGSLFMPQYSVSPSSHVAFEVMHAAGLAKSKETHYIPRAPLLPPGSPSAKGVPATTANSSPGKLSDILSRSLHSPGYGSKDDYEGGHVDSSSLTLDECVTAIFEYLNHAPADEGAEATLGGSGGNSKSNSVIDDPDWDKQSSATGGSDGASSSLSQTGGSASSSRIINRASTKVGGLSQAVRRTPQFEDALKTVVQAFAPMETHLQSHSYLCGDEPGADDFVRFSHLQPMLYTFAPLWGYDTPLFKKLPAIEAWCAKLQERDSNPFNELYHNTEHLYATGLNARREYSNRYIPDTAIGIGLGSLTDSSLKSTGAPVVKRKAKKKAASNLSSNICV